MKIDGTSHLGAQAYAKNGQSAAMSRLEPSTRSAESVAADVGGLPAVIEQQPQTAAQRVADGRDVRHMTPREMTDISFDFYAAGLVSWDEYSEMAFQPELHPDYDRTIGALTGEKAEPDRPRDFIAKWQDRLTFERKYASDPQSVGRARRILGVLTDSITPTKFVV